MKFPPYLVGASLLFWGWQGGHPLIAAALALALEAPRHVRFRLEFTQTDYRRIADFCAVLFAAVALLLLVNQGTTRGVLSTLLWLPVLVAPVLLAQRVGETGLIRASALFHYVRRQVRRDPGFDDPALDISGPYVALVLVAAGTARSASAAYFAGVVLLTAWGLLAARPRGASLALFATLLGVAAGAGYAGQAGLREMQVLMEAWVEEYLIMLPNDPERSVTRIGSIGRLKEHDTIALRLFAPPREEQRLHLLHIASFNEYSHGIWLAREVQPATQPSAPAARTAAIVLRVGTGRTLLPLPADTVDIVGLPVPARRTGLGAAITQAPSGWLRYEVSYGEQASGYAPPGPADLSLPPDERGTLQRVAAQLGLAPGNAVATLARYFQGFEYSTWRDSGVAPGITALEDFLLKSRSGHCEYFAAATTLLLRAAGIPARYATGFAAVEYSTLEGAWLVRARHAHAWARAWIGGRWVDVDLTPAAWVEADASLAPAWEQALDLARWAAFRWSTRSEEDASPLWWLAVAVLSVILAWRIVKQRRALRLDEGARAPERPRRGADSEFYALERALTARFRARQPHEALSVWISGLKDHFPEREFQKIQALLELHYRYRFDPQGLSSAERAQLRQAGASA